MQDLLWHLASDYVKCVHGWAGVRYVIAKFSRMDSLPNFLTHGAPLRARESSAIRTYFIYQTELVFIYMVLYGPTFIPDILNPFVLIWGCLLYCEYTAYGIYQKKLNSNISLYDWVVAKLFILWTRIPSTKNLNSYSFHIRTEFCPIISDMSCLPLKALIFCLFYKMYLMAVLQP